MNSEDRINDRDDNNEIQGNDSENQGDFQEEQNGDETREEVEIVTEEKPEENETANTEQLKRILMSYVDKIVEEKINFVRPKQEEVKEEVEEVEEETLFNKFKDL